jgi:hypothetical protein
MIRNEWQNRIQVKSEIKNHQSKSNQMSRNQEIKIKNQSKSEMQKSNQINPEK